MRFAKFLASVLPLALASVAQCQTNFYYPPDCSQKPGFENYGFSHFSINTPNLDRAIKFYTEAFGARNLFIWSPIPQYKAAYIGHNTNNYPSCQAWTAASSGTKGNIELLYLENPSETLAPSTTKPNLFSHIGIYTPDVAATCKRVAALGGKIVKPAGANITSLTGPIANSYGLYPARTKNLSAAQKQQLITNFNAPIPGVPTYCFATDPDGNLLEIQPLPA